MELCVDTDANGPRLRIRDLETGAAACVDAFVLRSLCLLPPEALTDLCRATVPVEDEGAETGRRAAGACAAGACAAGRPAAWDGAAEPGAGPGARRGSVRPVAASAAMRRPAVEPHPDDAGAR